MTPRELLNAMSVAVRLKDETRHCYTAGGRHESVAEHSWMMTLMAFFMKDDIKAEFPEMDIDKVIHMCIIHDLGECFTGDIPVFEKTDSDEEKEGKLLNQWVESLPASTCDEMKSLYAEMDARQTPEAKLYKAIDSLEAVIQHNYADISTWADNEYDLQRDYAWDRVRFSDYMTRLREEIRKDTEEKIEAAKQ